MKINKANNDWLGGFLLIPELFFFIQDFCCPVNSRQIILLLKRIREKEWECLTHRFFQPRTFFRVFIVRIHSLLRSAFLSHDLTVKHWNLIKSIFGAGVVVVVCIHRYSPDSINAKCYLCSDTHTHTHAFSISYQIWQSCVWFHHTTINKLHSNVDWQKCSQIICPRYIDAKSIIRRKLQNTSFICQHWFSCHFCCLYEPIALHQNLLILPILLSPSLYQSN